MATKCSNCSTDALYEYQITAQTSVFYCAKDLPRFLYARRDAGHLKITDALTENLNAAVEVLSPAPVDEPEEEAPKKKAPKKKAE